MKIGASPSGRRSRDLPPRTTIVVSPTFSTSMPIATSALAMCRVSSLCSTPCSVVVPSESAASTSPRFVMDLEPGTVHVAVIEPPSGVTSSGPAMAESISDRRMDEDHSSSTLNASRSRPRAEAATRRGSPFRTLLYPCRSTRKQLIRRRRMP